MWAASPGTADGEGLPGALLNLRKEARGMSSVHRSVHFLQDSGQRLTTKSLGMGKKRNPAL